MGLMEPSLRLNNFLLSSSPLGSQCIVTFLLLSYNVFVST